MVTEHTRPVIRCFQLRPAILGVGLLFLIARADAVDEPASSSVYVNAAQRGDPVAERVVGLHYLSGRGGEKDDSLGYAWLYAAARQDDTVAERFLGNLYGSGVGVARDDRAAFAWYYAAARHDDVQSERELGLCYVNGRGVAQDDKAAFAWFYTAARHDDVIAERYLGFLYRTGRGVAQNDPIALAWYRIAARHDDAISERNLGTMYRLGRGIPPDDKAAFAWYYPAARQDDAIAETNLGFLYQQGRGVTRDDQAAFAWYWTAATRHDDANAEQYLGALYRTGRGVARDDHAAFAWSYRSAQLHDPFGEWNLSLLYELGRGTPQDTRAALAWGRQALTGLPQNEALQQHVAILSLRDFLETRDTNSLDVGFIVSAFHGVIVIGFLLTAVVYAALGALLGIFTFRRTGPPRLALALGWISFYIESQFVAIFAALLLGGAVTANMLIVMIAVWGALPVVLFSLGSNWHRQWQPSTVAWPTQAAWFVTCALAIIVSDFAYDQLLVLVTGHHLAEQATSALFTKAKDSSPWIALANIGLVLPIAEEILFRGYLYDALKKRWSAATTVILTAFAFALVHFQLAQFPLLFGMGLVLGWAKLKTGSLRLPVLLHATNNSLVMIFAS